MRESDGSMVLVTRKGITIMVTLNSSVVAQKVGTLDDGTAAFMQWLDLVNIQQYPTNSLDTPLILRKFIKDKQAILYDKNLGSEIDVEIKEGVPFCILRLTRLFPCRIHYIIRTIV